MKRSELSEYIKETIVGLLSEEEGTVTTDDADKAKELADKGVNVNLTTEDIDDKEAVANPDDSVAKIADKIQKNIEKRLAVLDQWKKAEGKEKEELLDRLKALSKTITDLEKLL